MEWMKIVFMKSSKMIIYIHIHDHIHTYTIHYVLAT